MMRKYEIMYIVRPTLDESATKSLIKEFNNIFESMDSKVTKCEEKGLKDLAYEIEKHTKGYYVLLEVESTNEALEEFKRKVRISEDIIRNIELIIE